MAPFRFSLVLVLGLHFRAAWSSKALDLLNEEESELTQRRVDFEAWCQKEVATQEKQRQELLELRSSFNGEDTAEEPVDVTSVLDTAKQLQLLQQKVEPSSHGNLNLAVQCLSELESQLSSQASSWAFGEQKSLEAVRKVLGDAKEQKALSLSKQNLTLQMASLPTAELEMLKARQLKAAEAQAAQRAKGLAARSGRQVLDAAVAQTNAALSDAAGVCGLGRTVMNRTEVAGKQLVKQALELIGRAEGAAEAMASKQAEVQVPAAATKPHGTDVPATDSHAPATSAELARLLEVSQQLQQQQQQMQQQMAELRQLQAVAASRHVAADAGSSAEPLLSAAAPLQDAAPPAPQPASKPVSAIQPSKPARTAKPVKPSMSLAAEAAEDSKLDLSESEEKELETLPTPAHSRKRRHQTLEPHEEAPSPAIKVHDESLDIPKMQAPKDFPAALRGGWQGLLAKKRAEIKKKPSKPDDGLGIMELMQTPKTYTAWQPDQSTPASATKAKEDLLAAEKALDDDDTDKPVPAKKDQSFQPQRASLADPFSFFQFGSEVQRPFLSAPPLQDNLVAALIHKFAAATNSTLLTELSPEQLSKESLQNLLRKLETESPDAGEDSELKRMCETYQQETSKSIEEDFSKEVHNHYMEAKAQEERKIFKREVAAREHLLVAFGNTSHRLMAAKQLIQHGAASDRERFQKLGQEVEKLGQSKASTELQTLLGSFGKLVEQEEEELTDAVVAAASRQEQAESRDQSELQELRARVAKLDSSSLPASAALKAERGKLEHVCSVTMKGIEARRLQHEAQLIAIRSALALASQLALP